MSVRALNPKFVCRRGVDRMKVSLASPKIVYSSLSGGRLSKILEIESNWRPSVAIRLTARISLQNHVLLASPTKILQNNALLASPPADSQDSGWQPDFPGLGLVIALRGVFLHRKAWRTHNLSANQCKSIFVYFPASCLDERSTGGQPEGVTALHMICGGADRFAERSAIATELVRLCASVNIRHSRTKATPILRAAGSGSEQMVRLLLGLRADPKRLQRSRSNATGCGNAQLWQGT